MANFTPSQIIETRDFKRLPVSERVRVAQDTTQGLTDELSNSQFMKALGNTAPAYLEESDWTREPTVPTLDVILSRLNVKADNDPTGEKAARKFVNDFPKKASVWKDKITKDPIWGARGWDTVKEAFHKTANDLMNVDIASARKKAMEGETAWEKAASTIGDFMFPRVKAAGVEGRSPEPNEWVRDAASNVAYAIPVGRVAKVATKAAPAAVKFGAGTLSQFVAPTAVATADYAVDDNYDSGDLGTDALVGGLTNLGVNRVLGPAIGRGVSTLAGKVSTRMSPTVRAALEGASTPLDLAEEKIANAKNVLDLADKPFNAMNLVQGMSTGISAGEKASAQGIKEVADAAGKTLEVSKGKFMKPSEVIEAVGRATKDKLKKQNENDVVGSIIQQLNHPETAPFKKGGKVVVPKEFREGAKRYSKILGENSELKALFAPTPKVSAANVLSPLETYAVNQWGSSKNAPAVAAGSAFGIDVKKLKDDNTARKVKEQSKVAASQVLSDMGGLTDEDRMYLGQIRENPKMLTFSQDDGFKQWLLRRGHSLLKGTAAHRPLWEVR